MARRTKDEWLWQVLPGQLILSQPATPLQARGMWQPCIDLFETQREFILKAELAGVEPEHVQVAYVPGRHSLLLRGVRQEIDPSSEERSSIHQLEIYYGEFEREISLPQTPVEPERMRAQFRNGILYVGLPKATLRVTHTRITIRKV